MSQSQPPTQYTFGESEVVCDAHRPFLCAGGGANVAEALHQLPGVNADWTCRRAHPVGGASVQRHIGKLAVERGIEFGLISAFLQPRHLTAHNDALPRCQAQLTAGALGFAITAFDALINLSLN